MPAPLMRATFVRTAGARDRIYVARADGSEASWEFPTYGDAPPHDLVHLIAEAELGIANGLWGRVAAGADLGAVAAAANRMSGGIAEKYAALGDLREVLISEAVAAIVTIPRGFTPPHRASPVGPPPRSAQEGLALGASVTATADARRAMLEESAARFGADLPPSIDAAALERVCDRLAEVAARWRGLGAKGALVFTWPDGVLLDPAEAARAATRRARGGAGPSPAPRRRGRSRR